MIGRLMRLLVSGMLFATSGLAQGTPEPRVQDSLEQGRPIVEAVYAFRAEKGLWPQRLDDLSPDFVGSSPAASWEYRWDPGGESNLRCRIGGVDGEPHFLVYVFGGDDEGWHAGRSGEYRDLPDPPPSSPRAAHPARDRVAATVVEFDRRIAREPREPIHRCGKITLLFNSKEYEAAKKACVEWVRADPLEWRARWAFLEIEVRRLAGVLDDAETARKWQNAKHATLARWRLFNYPLSDTGALARFPAALELPAVQSPDEWLVAEIAYLDAIERTTDQEKFSRTIEICDTWEANASRSEGAVIQDWYYFRGAARLALGDFEGAQRDAERASAADQAGRISYRGVDALGQAVKNKDTKYRRGTFNYQGRWRIDVR